MVTYEELQICAALYPNVPGELHRKRLLFDEETTEIWYKNRGINAARWYDKISIDIVYTAPKEIIQSLLAKRLIKCQGRFVQDFYVLDKHSKSKEYKELRVQIALGLVQPKDRLSQS